jgi:hypothetical protein
MSSTVLEDTIDVPFTFRQRPTPLPCDLRPAWRLHLLVLIVDRCWGGKATLEQLHVLNWASRTEETRAAFLQFIRGRRAPNQIIVRYDPSLSRAAQLALAEGIVVRFERQLTLAMNSEPSSTPYRLALTEKGRRLVREIAGMKDCFIEEKRFFDAIRRKVTQTEVEALFNWSGAR